VDEIKTSNQQALPAAKTSCLLSDTIGNALYWFIFLLLIPILDTLGLLAGANRPASRW